MTYWTKSQLHALDAIGVPLYTSTAEQAQPDSSGYTYRLDRWCLHFEERLPVDGYLWLNQLAAHFDTRPTEIKADSATQALDVSRFATSHLSPDEKQKLWHSLSSWLP